VKGRHWLMRAIACVALAVTSAGCGGGASAGWKDVQVTSGYERPREITLKVFASAEGGDVTSLEWALVDAFGKLDIHATPLDEADAKPNLFVVVEKWEPGSRDAHEGLAVAGAVAGVPGASGLAGGEIVVDVKAVRANGQLTIQGKARSFVDRNPDASLHAIAELIARAVATGQAWPEPPPQQPNSGYR
jgi:hypothetical protein